MLNFKSWKTFLILSIIIPMGLLTTFRLTGLLKEPLTISESETLTPSEWKLERPYYMITINDTVHKFFNDELVSVNTSIIINIFIHDSWDYGGSSFMSMNVTVTAATRAGFVHSVNITFHEHYKNSEIRFFRVYDWPKHFSRVENLSIVKYAHLLRGEGLKAFMELAGVNNPQSVYFNGVAHWVLRSPYDQSHRLEVVFEIVYFNGSGYKKVVQPSLLKLAPDGNNGLEEAEEISFGNYSELYIGGEDAKDFYKIYVKEGERIRVWVNSTPKGGLQPNFSLHLYNPEQNPIVEKREDGYSHTIDVIAESSGFWFIEVRIYANHGFYSMEVNK